MRTLNVSDIQRFSIGDGPGIRSTVFLKGCNLHCPWCHNPETRLPEPQTLEFAGSGEVKHYGRLLTTAEVAADVLEDVEFYRESGGGVTLGGGEPMLQFEGAAELAELLAEEGVPTLIDTAGNVSRMSFEAVRPAVNDYYYDIKAGNAEKYRELTGADFELVTANLRWLIGSGANVTVRVPFIPGANDSPEDCEEIARLIVSCGAGHADILPFHRLGSAKYKALGIDYKYENTPPPDREMLERALEIYRRYLDAALV